MFFCLASLDHAAAQEATCRTISHSGHVVKRMSANGGGQGVSFNFCTVAFLTRIDQDFLMSPLTFSEV
jgi:hypothetical protein